MSRPEIAPAAPYRRLPTSLGGWLKRAELDFAALGAVERVLATPPEILEAVARCEPEKYTQLLKVLAALVERHVAIADAATEAHQAILAATKGHSSRPPTNRSG